MKISKNKKCVFFSCPKDHSIQKLGSQVKRCDLQPPDGQTDRQTDTKMTTEGTLSGFQEFFFQPIIKDRPNKKIQRGQRTKINRGKENGQGQYLVWAAYLACGQAEEVRGKMWAWCRQILGFGHGKPEIVASRHTKIFWNPVSMGL